MYQLVALAVVLVFVLIVLGAYQRLFLSPIAHVPGPRLAALTLWYEIYYDVVQKGRYEWRIKEMHEVYGPIVRINPFEVHIADPDFYDNVYTGSQPGRKIDKWPFSARFFGNPGSMISTVPHDHHRLRRGALNPYFSKQAIRKLEPVLYESIDKVIAQTYRNKEAGTQLNLSDCFAAMTGDIIMDYSFGKNLGFLDDMALQKDWHALWVNLTGSGAMVKQFALFGTLLRVMPPWMAESWTSVSDCLARSSMWVLRRQILDIEEERTSADKVSAKQTMMNELIYGDLPESEKSLDRLVDEGQSIVGAGSITTAEMLSAAMFHLVDDQKLMVKLQEELKPIMQRTNGRPSQNDVEPLPYLNAVIKEALRLYFGISQRLPRVHDADMRYKDTIIPKGIPISMSSVMMHMDPKVFPNPETFNPDRWMDSSCARLDKYLVPFGKGTRQCLGINLAWAEMYLALANLCAPGRFHFLLYETDISDVKIEHDFFVGFPRLDTKGVRVSVQ